MLGKMRIPLQRTSRWMEHGGREGGWRLRSRIMAIMMRTSKDPGHVTFVEIGSRIGETRYGAAGKGGGYCPTGGRRGGGGFIVAVRHQSSNARR